MTAIALTIAGSDPSGGAGLQADLKTFHQHRMYGMSVVTLLTVQNTLRVDAVELLEPQFVLSQLDAVLTDFAPDACKTGALGSGAIIQTVASRAAAFGFPLVVDPVMISKHGSPLIDDDAVEILKRELVPLATIVTPNVHEAAILSGIEIDDTAGMRCAAEAIAGLGARHVVVKAPGRGFDANDVLLADGVFIELPADRIATRNTHGTGCVFAAAITARLGRGESVIDAVAGAKAFVTNAIRTAPDIGHGYGPTNLHATVPGKSATGGA